MMLSELSEHKTDAQIQEAVRSELQWTPDLDHSAIGVSVRDGVVELSGSVATMSERYIAVKVTQRVTGVTTVVDEITVQGEPDAADTDEKIGQQVSTMLKWYETLPGVAIRAEVHDAVVTLTGTAEWAYQRKAAQRSMQMLPKVRGVVNQIVLTPRQFPADTADRILDALHRQASLAGTAITVHAESGKVILRGTVSTLVQKHDAEQTAWKHPGVMELHNDIHVED
ncbi:BON domain-containing protein [Herbiconiux ginsengi]|nr:BON domain-containing protein [Herbiconiux ginsengi]